MYVHVFLPLLVAAGAGFVVPVFVLPWFLGVALEVFWALVIMIVWLVSRIFAFPMVAPILFSSPMSLRCFWRSSPNRKSMKGNWVQHREYHCQYQAS